MQALTLAAALCAQKLKIKEKVQAGAAPCKGDAGTGHCSPGILAAL